MAHVATVDFETYYDKDYSLTKMTTQEYILHELFQVMGVSVMVDDRPPKWIPGTEPERIEDALTKLIDLCPVWVAHNAMFDMGIMSLRYGLHPQLVLDTRMMANAIDKPYVKSASLATLARHHDLPAKGTAVVDMKGRRLETLSEQELNAYGEYCAHDTWLCRQLFNKYKKQLPNKELLAIHAVVEMFTHPTLEIDPAPLDAALAEEEQKEADVLAQVGGFTKQDINSNVRLKAALIMLGVNPPEKLSLKTHKWTPAFAKSDLEFVAILDHEDPAVRALVNARLTLKSNILKTRSERLKRLSLLGPMCAPFVYYAAHTGRLGGTDSLNLQNLPRGSKLRQALKAPKGHKIVAADLSQIEARLTAWLAKEDKILASYRAKEDLYCALATDIFNRPITKADTAERFVGKVAELSLQYGAGAATLGLMLRTSGQTLPPDLDISKLCDKTVDVYRQGHPKTVGLWRKLDHYIESVMMHVKASPLKLGPLTIEHERIRLPNGLYLHYSELARSMVESVYGNEVTTVTKTTYYYGGARKVLYGPKLLENVIQALARIVLRDHWLYLSKYYRIVLQVHDELVAVVPDSMVERAVEDFTCVMSVPPTWAEDLPVACEVSVGQNYLEAK